MRCSLRIKRSAAKALAACAWVAIASCTSGSSRSWWFSWCVLGIARRCIAHSESGPQLAQPALQRFAADAIDQQRLRAERKQQALRFRIVRLEGFEALQVC